MSGAFRSSGDLLADRRFAYAEGLAADGEHHAAEDLLVQTLERVPGWAPAWIALGLARERQGRLDAARQAFTQAEALDRGGLYGAGLHGARLRGATPDGIPAPFVAALFDDYADRFDSHLVEGLGYRAPALIAASLAEADGARRFARAVDLGCGTGLMAPLVRSRADHLTGVDLSPAMVARAERRGLYDRLVVDEIGRFLAAVEAASLDLVTAADVFAYLGPLAPVARLTARALRPGGLLAFTVQHLPDGDVRLGGDMRFSHASRHVAEALAGAGLDLAAMREASSRRDAGTAVPGLVVVARKP